MAPSAVRRVAPSAALRLRRAAATIAAAVPRTTCAHRWLCSCITEQTYVTYCLVSRRRHFAACPVLITDKNKENIIVMIILAFSILLKAIGHDLILLPVYYNRLVYIPDMVWFLFLMYSVHQQYFFFILNVCAIRQSNEAGVWTLQLTIPYRN